MNKIFSWIGELFTEIWKLFKKILPYIMIALAVFFTFGGSLTLFGMVLEGYAAAIAAMGLSFLVAPDETIDTVTGVADSIGEAAGAVIGGVTGGLVSGLSGGENGVWIAIAIAVGAWFLLNGRKDSVDVDVVGHEPIGSDGGRNKLSNDKAVVGKPEVDDMGLTVL